MSGLLQFPALCRQLLVPSTPPKLIPWLQVFEECSLKAQLISITSSGKISYNHPILFSQYASLPFHYASISLCLLFTYFSFTSLFPYVPLSLTHSDYASHEPSLPVLLPLICARFLYLFKTLSYCLYFSNLNLLSSL
jgi:hypothetical protein